MFEKGNYRDPASLSVQSVPAQKTNVHTRKKLGEPVAAGTTETTVEAAPSLPEDVSVISSQVVFRGELTAGQDIYIHGTIEGTIAHQSKNVIVGKEGRVRALIHATTVRVEGQVDGDIHGDDFVELKAGSRVDGDIYCSSIKIEKGARLNGMVNMA